MLETARDIAACDQCPFPVLPGDEIFVEKDSVAHGDHFTGLIPTPRDEPTYV